MIGSIKRLIKERAYRRHRNNVLLTGLPRSGTTLCCYLLSDQDDTVALNEPIQFGKCRSKREIVTKTLHFCGQTRYSLINKGEAFAKASQKGLVSNHFSDRNEKGVRNKLISRRLVKFDKPLSEDHCLVVKHNAAFTVALEELSETFPIYAIVRNPIAVLGSWNSVEIPVGKGRLKESLMNLIDIPNWSAENDVLDRQLALMDWYFAEYLKLGKERIVKYEDIIASDGAALSVITNNDFIRSRSLESKNKSKNYSGEKLAQLGDRLLRRGGHFQEFYSNEEVDRLLSTFLANG